MPEHDDESLEDSFLSRNETLRGFYDSDVAELSEREQASLTPILNSLQDVDAPRYEELEHIAEGGEKKITLVHDHRLDRRVAMARAARAKAPQDLEGFLREARLTANLSHPNIMPVHNMGLDAHGVPFFSMELVPGDSLKSILKKLDQGDEVYRQNYSVENLLNIYLKVCDAIAYAHSRNVLHLDIKPDNIKVGVFGEVFVCDWGLARITNRKDEDGGADSLELDGDLLNDLTLSGTLKGTPGFMAPEQTEAYAEKTTRTDVYALGALLYIILTRKLPVDGKSANEVIQNTREGRVIHPRRRLTSGMVSKSLAAVAMKALSRDPEQRYESVLALRHEISLYLSGHPTQAEHAGFITSTSLLLHRHSRISFLLIFFLLLLAGVISVNLVAISREKADAIAAREEAEETFALYRKEQQLAVGLGEDLGEALIYTATSTEYKNAHSMIRVISSGLREEADTVSRNTLLMQKGRLHFVIQEFNAANACFSELDGPSKELASLRKISQQFSEVKADDTALLKDEQLAALIDQARFSERGIIYYMYYHHMRRRPDSARVMNYVPLAKAMLDKINYLGPKRTPALKVTQLGAGRFSLDLSNSDYSSYFIRIQGPAQKNVLYPLRLKSLDISHSKLTNIRVLFGLRLDSLKMYGVQANKKTVVDDLRALKLKQLGISEDAYPKSVLAQLRKMMKVLPDPAKKKP